VTQPEVLDMAREAASAIETADEAEPTGLMGMLKASHDDEVRRGMAVLLEVLRHVGRGAHAIGKGGPRERRPKPVLTKKGRDLSAILGPSGKAGTRTAPPAPRAPVRASVPTAAPAAPKPAASTAAVPAAIPGVAFTPDGFLADANAWTRDIGTAIAAQAGIALTDEHWGVIDWARGDFLQYGASPNVRRITIGTGLPTKDIYRLFPKAPGTTIARIAGIKKPVGCI